MKRLAVLLGVLLAVVIAPPAQASSSFGTNNSGWHEGYTTIHEWKADGSYLLYDCQHWGYYTNTQSGATDEQWGCYDGNGTLHNVYRDTASGYMNVAGGSYDSRLAVNRSLADGMGPYLPPPPPPTDYGC